jgi:Phytanoyl-CoA dioxygenase (PhyH)
MSEEGSRPQSADEALLDASEVARFHDEGYLVRSRLLDPERLGALREAYDRILAGAGRDRLLVFRTGGLDGYAPQVHVVGAWLADELLRALALDPAITGPICQLMGTETARLFRDQLFMKPPFSGSIVPWHQDYSDWTHTTPPGHITCWIALDDATPESGCVHYVPGSHSGLVLEKIDPRDTMESSLARIPEPARASWSPRPAVVPAGGCVFHHCLTIHGSHGNATASPRRAIAIAYMRPDTRSASSTRPVVPTGPRVALGDVIEGPLFPGVR